VFPARLHVLMARDAARAVVIRRGPARHVATLLWDRASDRVTLGHWFVGRIYERRSDLSPDGRHLIVFCARHYRMSDADETGGSWTALSRAPWLTALDLWAKGDAWNGGGGFADNQHYWLNGGHRVLRRESGLEVVPSPLGRQRNNECLGIYLPRLLRDGWRVEAETHDWSEIRLTKPLGHGWVLHKTMLAGVDPPQGAGVYRDEHLVEGPEGQVIAGGDWDWAEHEARVDGGVDLVYTSAGCLYRRAVDRAAGIGPARLVHDFNAMRFEAVAAPR